MKKIELHLHSDGSINVEYANKLMGFDVKEQLVGTNSTSLKNYLEKVAQSGPNKEGMMTQYWQLDAEPVESMSYWEESERYLREN